MVIPALRQGEYFARVSAVDADHFEGAFTPVASVRVVTPRLVPTPTPYRSLVELGAGLRCGLDGAALEPVAVALAVERRTAHTLRCALEGRDDAAVEQALPALSRSPLTLVTRLVVPEVRAREGHVRVRVIDHEGVDLTRDELRVRASGGVVAGDLSAAVPAEPGVWLVPVRWSEGVRSFALTVEVAGADPLRSEALVPPRCRARPRRQIPSPAGSSCAASCTSATCSRSTSATARPRTSEAMRRASPRASAAPRAWASTCCARARVAMG